MKVHEEGCCSVRDNVPYMAFTMATETVSFYFKLPYLVNLRKQMTHQPNEA